MNSKLVLIMMSLFIVISASQAYSSSDYFIELKENHADIDKGWAIFTITNPTDNELEIDAAKIGASFIEVKNGISDYDIYLKVPVNHTYTRSELDFCENVTSENATNETEEICHYVDTPFIETSLEFVNLEGSYFLMPDEMIDIKIIGYYDDLAVGDGVKIDWIPFVKDNNYFFGMFYQTIENPEWSWWNTSWSNCKNIELNESNGLDRENDLIFLSITNLTDKNIDNSDIRVLNGACGNETATSISYNITSSDTDSIEIALNVNATASSITYYSVYYNNSLADVPSFSEYSLVYFENFELNTSVGWDKNTWSTMEVSSLYGVESNKSLKFANTVSACIDGYLTIPIGLATDSVSLKYDILKNATGTGATAFNPVIIPKSTSAWADGWGFAMYSTDTRISYYDGSFNYIPINYTLNSWNNVVNIVKNSTATGTMHVDGVTYTQDSTLKPDGFVGFNYLQIAECNDPVTVFLDNIIIGNGIIQNDSYLLLITYGDEVFQFDNETTPSTNETSTAIGDYIILSYPASAQEGELVTIDATIVSGEVHDWNWTLFLGGYVYNQVTDSDIIYISEGGETGEFGASGIKEDVEKPTGGTKLEDPDIVYTKPVYIQPPDDEVPQPSNVSFQIKFKFEQAGVYPFYIAAYTDNDSLVTYSEGAQIIVGQQAYSNVTTTETTEDSDFWQTTFLIIAIIAIMIVFLIKLVIG